MAKRQYKIYLIHLKNTSLYKIGISLNPNKRVKQLQTGTPFELLLISVFESDFPFKTEKVLHNSYTSKKISENFNYDFDHLKGEWFNLTAQDVLAFTTTCETIERNINQLKKAGNPFV